MRITYLYQYFGTPEGGWSTRVYEMCRRWKECGHHVSVITALYDKSDLTASGIYSKCVIEGITIYVVNVTMSNKNSFYYRLFSFFWFGFVSFLIGMFIRMDAVIASSGPITIGAPALLVKFLKRKPLIFEVRDLWPEGAIVLGLLNNRLLQKLAYWFEKVCYKNSSLVVSCSEGIDQSIKNRFPETHTIIIPNAADVGLFRDTALLSDIDDVYKNRKYFVYTGTLGLIDDCSQILRAAKALENLGRSDIQILLIGDGNEREILENLHQELELKNVFFLGQKPKLDLVSYVRQSRGTILTVKPIPYMDHCSPNKIFDSFAAGIPILQTTQGWIKRMVERNKCGINVNPNDPVHFAEAMIKLADNNELFMEMSSNSAKLGDLDFNRDILSNRMILEIEKV